MDHALVELGDGWKNYTSYHDTMTRYFSGTFVYTPAYGLPETVGMREWYYGEYAQWFVAFPDVYFNQIIFLGDSSAASSRTYSLGVWKGQLGPLMPTKRLATANICDMYLVRDGRITHDWMMLDMLDLMRQAGHVPLSLSPLPQGKVAPPAGMDGLPAPLSPFVQEHETHASRRVVEAVLDSEWRGASAALRHWHEDFAWYGPVPFGLAKGAAEYREHFLRPFHAAFADRQVALDVLVCEGTFCAAHGTFQGTHVGAWLGQRASHRRLSLSFGMHWHVRDGKVLESWALFDLPKMFLGMGVDLLGARPALYT